RAVQQRELGNAARVPARIALQRPRRLAICRHGRVARRTRRAGEDAQRAHAGARARGRPPRTVLADRGDAAAWRDLGDALAFRFRLQGGAGARVVMLRVTRLGEGNDETASDAPAPE